jgi:hypothetical protein
MGLATLAMPTQIEGKDSVFLREVRHQARFHETTLNVASKPVNQKNGLLSPWPWSIYRMETPFDVKNLSSAATGTARVRHARTTRASNAEFILPPFIRYLLARATPAW